MASVDISLETAVIREVQDDVEIEIDMIETVDAIEAGIEVEIVDVRNVTRGALRIIVAPSQDHKDLDRHRFSSIYLITLFF